MNLDRAFHTPFPEGDEILAIYYALQEAGMPCVVVRSPDPAMVRVSLDQDIGQPSYPERVQAFIAGWVACHNREALPFDGPLTVSRVPKP